MKRIRKNEGNKVKKFDPHKRTNKNNFAKNPKNGGTPAIEKREIVKALLKKVVAPKAENE
jgi:hypothetical protein